MAKIDGLEIVMTKQMQKMIDKELKKRFEELKPELATRYEELLNMRNMEADQFNDGFNDARAGKLETDHPHYDLDTDNWRLGYAYGMFEPMKEKLAREHQLSDALYLLLVDDPNTKLKAEQILIDIYGKREPSPSDVSVTQDVTTPEPPEGACGMSEISEKAIKKDVPFITYIIHDKNMKNGRTVTVYKPTQEYYILFELIKFRRLPSTFPDIGITVISEGLEPSSRSIK